MSRDNISNMTFVVYNITIIIILYNVYIIIHIISTINIPTYQRQSFYKRTDYEFRENVFSACLYRYKVDVLSSTNGKNISTY